MKHSPCAAILLIAALLTLPSSNLLALESEATLEKIARSGEFVIGYRADSSALSYENANGELPAVGNTVDLEAASWTNTIGASELATVWTDPDFDPQQKAFYNGRVIEIPAPRWVVYDKVRFGAHIPDDAKLIQQERAYTSPIWYTP